MKATRGAVFRALDGGSAGALASVFTEVPQDTQPDFIKIGSIDSTNIGAKPEDQREELLVEVLTVYRGEDRDVLHDMMHAVRSDLDRQAISAPGAALRPPRFVGAIASDAMGDGVTYVGVSHFTIQAQPA